MLLRDVIGESDTVLAWSPFERSQLNEIAREHPQFVARDESLDAWVDALTKTRIFDLHKCAVDQYYHPGMRGRTSIKVVLDDPRQLAGRLRPGMSVDVAVDTRYEYSSTTARRGG